MSNVAMEKEESYHFEMDMKMGIVVEGLSMEIPMTFLGDFQTPDRVQGTLSMSFIGTDTEIKSISIGDTLYQKNPFTGEWEISTETASPFAPSRFVGSDPFELDDLILVGEETLDGSGVYHIRGKAPPKVFDGAEGDLQADVWIGVEDSLLRQITIEGELEFEDDAGLFPGGGSAGTFTVSMTMKLSDYGEPVEIVAPDVKPTPAPFGAIPGANTGPGERVVIQAPEHVSPGQPHPTYNTVPATSGWHYPSAIPWGIYTDSRPDEDLVHGGIGIHYDCPEGCDDLVQQLTGIADDYSLGIVLSPYSGMDTRIALTAWGWIDRFDEFDEQRILDFINRHMDRGPERLH